MKVFLTGADGFVGGQVSKELQKRHQVLESMYGKGDYALDLSDYQDTVSVLKRARPDAIVHCAGIVDKSEKARLNVVFTDNLLRAALEAGISPRKVIVCGSASEYGLVDAGLPISEEYPRNPVGEYGLAKAAEVDLALKFAKQTGVSVVVARIFNPIGVGMPPQLLVPSLIRQMDGVKSSDRQDIEISRLDSRRDYIDVRDVAIAFAALLENDVPSEAYNIGRGQEVTNKELVNILFGAKKISPQLRVVETEANAEPQVASQADISRITKATGWRPKYSLEETIEEMMK